MPACTPETPGKSPKHQETQDVLLVYHSSAVARQPTLPARMQSRVRDTAYRFRAALCWRVLYSVLS